jgi:transposase
VRYHHTNRVKDYIDKLDANITFKFIPPYSSDLNAIEHLWKDVRKNITHNYLFEGISAIVTAITKYFMNVKRNPAKIRRMCAYIY